MCATHAIAFTDLPPKLYRTMQTVSTTADQTKKILCENFAISLKCGFYNITVFRKNIPFMTNKSAQESEFTYPLLICGVE